MESAVEEARESEGLNTQNIQDTQGQSNFPQNTLPTYTQAAPVPNGTEVAIGTVPQVIESHQDQGEENLSISNATAVQVAVAVSAGDGGVSMVDGSLAAAERTAEDGSLVTAIPAEYGLAASLAPQYVIQHGSPTDEEGAVGDLDGDDRESRDDVLREQDRFLPIANVARIMKKSIPKTGKIAKDAKECVQECVSEFISFITSEASERCHQEKRKTINGEDILFAMQTLGFDNYVEPLKLYLQKYRESIKGEKSLTSTTEGRQDLEDEDHAVQPYQVGHMHPTMITSDQTPTTIYGTPQFQTAIPQQLHFQ